MTQVFKPTCFGTILFGGMSSKLAFGGITKFFFQNLTFGNRVFQNHRRSDLAKPRQTDTARSCLLWNNQWCYKQFSEQHCLEPFFLKAIMRVCFLCHHQAIFKAWHLAMGCRRTIGRSDLAKPHQTDTEPSFEERSAIQPPMILKTIFKSSRLFFLGNISPDIAFGAITKGYSKFDNWRQVCRNRWEGATLPNYFKAAVPPVVRVHDEVHERRESRRYVLLNYLMETSTPQRAGMVWWIRRIPHASDPGSIPGCNTRRTGGPLPHPCS